MESIARGLQRAARVMAALSAAAVVVIMVLMLADVVARNWVLHQSIRGAYELVETFLVLVVAFGITRAEQLKENPRVTLFTDRFSRLTAAKIRLLGELVMTLVAVWLAYGTTMGAIVGTQRQEITQGLLDYPIWPTKIFLAVGFVVLALYLVNDLVLSVRRIARGELPEAPSGDLRVEELSAEAARIERASEERS